LHKDCDIEQTSHVVPVHGVGHARQEHADSLKTLPCLHMSDVSMHPPQFEPERNGEVQLHWHMNLSRKPKGLHSCSVFLHIAGPGKPEGSEGVLMHLHLKESRMEPPRQSEGNIAQVAQLGPCQFLLQLQAHRPGVSSLTPLTQLFSVRPQLQRPSVFIS